MQKRELYVVARADYGVDVTPIRPETGEYEGVRWRLIADEGKQLRRGDDACGCVDTDAPDEWTEEDAPEADLEAAWNAGVEEAIEYMRGGNEDD